MATWDGYNQSIIANRFQKSFMVNYVDLSGRLLVRRDASFNNRLFVMNDASFAGNVYVDDILTANIDEPLNYMRDKRLFVQNDASFMANVYVDDNLTTNLKMISIRDTSLNSNVVVGRDISCNGNINIGRNITVLGNIAIKNYTATNVINTTTTNYSLAVVEDISLNGRVTVSSDTSLNGNLFVSRDISLNGNVNGTVNFINDISVNGMNVGGGPSSLSTFCGNLVGSRANFNTFVGYKSFTINTGDSCTGLGFHTGLSVTTGVINTAIGSQSLNDTTTGEYNVGVGYNSGTLNPTGSNMTAIGYGTVNGNPGSVRNNTTIIGAGATMGGSGRFSIGTVSQTVIIPRIERFLTPPMMIRTISSAVSFNTGGDTVILWGTSNYAGSNVAISYNATTGAFSSTESHIIGVSVSVSFTYASNANGNRALWIKHSNAAYNRVGQMEMQASYIDVTGLNVSANFTLDSSESFSILGWQNSGGTVTASAGFSSYHPCRVMITTY
jgi:hypothetical protein